MADTPPVIVPPAAGVVATAGTQPLSPVVQALQKVEADLKAELSKPQVDQAIVTGIFGYLSLAFPVLAPELTAVGSFISKAVGALL